MMTAAAKPIEQNHALLSASSLVVYAEVDNDRRDRNIEMTCHGRPEARTNSDRSHVKSIYLLIYTTDDAVYVGGVEELPVRRVR